ncbi:MAG: DUF58 domain-containing protein [Deltaproteobacteria bacterium]|nr:DUF58 domain-containing protein [Deltaproteobacteria bacterium]
MTPYLSTRGRLLLASALVIMLGGAVRAAWPLIALGGLVLSTLITMHMLFYPTAVLLRRRKIELAWWVPPSDTAGGAIIATHPFQLHVALRNHGPRALRIHDLQIFCSSALEVDQTLRVTVPRGTESELSARTVAAAAGHWFLHGASLEFGDPLGCFRVRAYFPNPLGVKVFPKLSAARGAALVARPQAGALHERAGLHHVRRKGLGGELREIREHTQGDAFKQIAWKASARARKLMVRELESEIVVTHQILLDVAGSMRQGEVGRAKLDYGIEVAAAFAREALDAGDRVGLTTFDARVIGAIEPRDGKPQLMRIVDHLLELRNLVDEDLTELTDGELVTAVARYLAHQEALDVRVPRPARMDDPRWSRLAAGPGGELYDLDATGRVVATLLKARPPMAGRHAQSWYARVVAGDPEMARLRLFARVRGIEVPYRRDPPPGGRVAGFGAALAKGGAGHAGKFVIVISDLEGILEDADSALRQLAVARQRGHHVAVVCPFGPAFAKLARTPSGQRVGELLAGEERRRAEQARRNVERLGIPVLMAGPEDVLLVLVRRLARARAALRGRVAG